MFRGLRVAAAGPMAVIVHQLGGLLMVDLEPFAHRLLAIIITLDQLTKLYAMDALSMYQPVAVLPGINFTLMYNTGAAFSFLSDAGGWQRWFFTTLAFIVSAIILVWLHRSAASDRWQLAALALILGGAQAGFAGLLAFLKMGQIRGKSIFLIIVFHFKFIPYPFKLIIEHMKYKWW